MSKDFSLTVPGLPGMEGVELLQKVPLFAKLDFNETTRLRGITLLERFKRGHVLIEQDALGVALYIVRSGELEVRRVGDRDEETVLGRLGQGEVVGEMALLDDLLTAARVVCITDCELLMLPRANFEYMLAESPDLALKVYRSFCTLLTSRLRAANLKLSDGAMR